MKNTFREYNPIDTELLADMWRDAIFIFDTNILLNLYRYSVNTSDEFIQIISELNERVWLPYQVGLEFNRNRLNVLSEQKKNYSDFEKNLNELIGEIENKNRNPFFSQQLTDKIIEIKVELNTEIKSKIEAYESNIKSDTLLEKINSVFENKVGKPFSSEEILNHQKEGEKRYKNKVPPGYCDHKKSENERYGDLLIWKEIIQKSKDSKTNVIFILDDRKEDWWFEHQGKTISPRQELIKEFHTETNKNIHFYKPFQFLEYSNQYLEKQIAKEVIEEVKNYKPTLVKNDNFIQLFLTLMGDAVSFDSLTAEIKNSGYNIITESDDKNNKHFINITLPNIPDLERRFNSKFVSKLSDYDLILVETNKTI